MCQSDNGYGDKNAFGSDAKESIGETQSRKVDEFRLPRLRYRRAGQYAIDIASQALIWMASELQCLCRQDE